MILRLLCIWLVFYSLLTYSVLKSFIIYSCKLCSTCFGQHFAHHQELTNKQTTAGNTSTSVFIRKPEAATAVQLCSWWWAKCCPKHVEQRLHDYIKKKILTTECVSGWLFCLKTTMCCYRFRNPQLTYLHRALLTWIFFVYISFVK
jgi:hypothetical protein